MPDVDVVVIGGGLGGTSLGQYLARAGLTVTVLERETEFKDRVRGEWMAPWGAAELERLGLYERFIAAGGHHLSRHIAYDEITSPEAAEAGTLPIAQLHPEVPGPLCMQHVVMQNESLAAAVEAGALVRRGVSRTEVDWGDEPVVRFSHEGKPQEVSARLVVGADGRASGTRRSLGIPLHEAPLDHLIAGLLVDGVDGWPEDLQSIGKVGDIQYLIFPQGSGRARLYADYAFDGVARFTGDDGAREMLAAFEMDCVPASQAIANANPIGPCRSYPSQDAWVDAPFADRAVLIGDAAGYNDPILGQGLSVTLRDARMVGEVLTSEATWSPEAFSSYAEERRERLRRLRFIASFITTLSARFGPEDVERRQRAFERIEANPELMSLLLGAYLGPESLEPVWFTPEHYEAVFGTREYLVA